MDVLIRLEERNIPERTTPLEALWGSFWAVLTTSQVEHLEEGAHDSLVLGCHRCFEPVEALPRRWAGRQQLAWLPRQPVTQMAAISHPSCLLPPFRNGFMLEAGWGKAMSCNHARCMLCHVRIYQMDQDLCLRYQGCAVLCLGLAVLSLTFFPPCWVVRQKRRRPAGRSIHIARGLGLRPIRVFGSL